MSLRSWWQRKRNDLRAAGLMGRAFGLRDRGQFEQALAVCRQAIALAAPASEDDSDPGRLSTFVIGALTIDEIATRLGQPHLAREPLAQALLVLQPFNRKHASRANELLVRYEQRLRARLDELR